MPSQKSLRDAGRSDIVNALKRFGGAEKVAASMGLEFGTQQAFVRERARRRRRLEFSEQQF